MGEYSTPDMTQEIFMNLRTKLWLIVILLLGSAALGGFKINNQGYWYDEIVSIESITDYASTAQRFPEQMPAYFVALRGWVDQVGQSEVAGRWFSLLFGLLTLALLYRLGSRYVSSETAIIGLIILASSAFFIRYYREMRPYTFLAFFCVLSMWFYLEWLRTGKIVHGMGYLIASLIAVYIHYFAGLLFAAQGIYFLVSQRSITLWPRLRFDRKAGLTLTFHALTIAALLPYLGSYLSGLSMVAALGKYQQALDGPQAVMSLAITLTNGSLALFVVLFLLAFLS
jgi:uncharacterized membrane protein